MNFSNFSYSLFSLVLPKNAISKGFSTKPISYKLNDKFNLKSGFCLHEKYNHTSTPLDILKIFMNESFFKVINEMKNQMIRKRPENITLNRNLFWRYVSYILASGIVQISREEIYHKIPKSFSRLDEKNSISNFSRIDCM